MHNYFDTMNRAQKQYGRMMDSVMRSWALTRNELNVLLFLANNPHLDRAVDIVTNRGMAKSHVSMSVASLEQRGFLERLEDPSDKRTVHLKLTDAATPVILEGRRVQYAFFSDLHRNVTEEEIEKLISFTRKIRANLEIMEEKLG